MYKRNPLLEEAMYFGTYSLILERARFLRKEATVSEKILWKRLNGKQILGYKFRRQHPINQFIVDFFSLELKLIIEVDGGYHLEDDQKERDEGRTYILNEFGLRVIRFSNDQILNNLEEVVTEIKQIALAHYKSKLDLVKFRKNPTQPSPEDGEG